MAKKEISKKQMDQVNGGVVVIEAPDQKAAGRVGKKEVTPMRIPRGSMTDAAAKDPEAAREPVVRRPGLFGAIFNLIDELSGRR